MRSAAVLRCSNRHTIGLDRSNTHVTAAAVKAASGKQGHYDLRCIGGDALRYRQLKNTCSDVGTGASNCAASNSKRPHVREERYNIGTWDYGSGKHYANKLTRSFYRAYRTKYHNRSSTGFTRESVASAELAMRLSMLKGILWDCLVYGSALYLLLQLWRGTAAPTIQEREEPSHGQLGKAQGHAVQGRTQLLPNTTAVQTSRNVMEWGERSRDRALSTTEGCPAPSRERVPSRTHLMPASASVTCSSTALESRDEGDDDDYES
ncbi:hypothetical protein, conserved [Leishmania tarentolae]|uniref:Uncharacterized protein n=1 Tax=Leishmania tarentolae TaxID=5689 RepID=A0A640KPM5_LEITA|nr:hypothetical protein, conserved [Leishmania tarentolae]